jgi:hypothetical protein
VLERRASTAMSKRLRLSDHVALTCTAFETTCRAPAGARPNSTARHVLRFRIVNHAAWSPLLWAVIVALAVSSCSRDATVVGKGPPQPTTDGKSRGASPQKAAATVIAKAPKLAANPLVRLSRSQAQRDAEAAKARSHLAKGPSAKGPSAKGPSAKGPSAKGPSGTKSAPTALETSRIRGSPGRSDRGRAPLKNPPSTGSAPKAVPVKPAVEMIVYDVASGVKTLIMANGTVKEEPFDPATLPTIKAQKRWGKPRVSIVNEDAPLETGTAIDGSKARPSANPDDEPLSTGRPEDKPRRPENHVR